MFMRMRCNHVSLTVVLSGGEKRRYFFCVDDDNDVIPSDT